MAAKPRLLPFDGRCPSVLLAWRAGRAETPWWPVGGDTAASASMPHRQYRTKEKKLRRKAEDELAAGKALIGLAELALLVMYGAAE